MLYSVQDSIQTRDFEEANLYQLLVIKGMEIAFGKSDRPTGH